MPSKDGFTKSYETCDSKGPERYESGFRNTSAAGDHFILEGFFSKWMVPKSGTKIIFLNFSIECC
jgi:hypothetical protein